MFCPPTTSAFALSPPRLLESVFPCCPCPQCQNLHDSEHLTWLIVNHIQDLIHLSHEPPVQDFISAVHRNAAASGLFIQAIQSRCENLSAVSLPAAGGPAPESRGLASLTRSFPADRSPGSCRFFSQTPAYHAEENPAVPGRDPPEPVGCRADAVRGQASAHAVPGAGPHGRHPGLPPGGNAFGRKLTGTEKTGALICIET